MISAQLGRWDGAMSDKKAPRFGLDELARQLAESMPQNLRAFGHDLERNFKAVLNAGLERMELVTRERSSTCSARCSSARVRSSSRWRPARGARKALASFARARAKLSTIVGFAGSAAARGARSNSRMSLARLLSRGQSGLESYLVTVEVHLAGGLPSFTITGLAAAARCARAATGVRAALQTSGYEFPVSRITAHLGPADVPKQGGRFDLAIALGVLRAHAGTRMGHASDSSSSAS
jgi:hypothetical protein